MSTKAKGHPLFLVPAMPSAGDVAPCPMCAWVLVRIRHPLRGDLWLSQRSDVTGKYNQQEPEHRLVCRNTSKPSAWPAPAGTVPSEPEPLADWL